MPAEKFATGTPVQIDKKTRYRLHRIAGRYPKLYFPIYRFLGRHPELAVNPNTELVIEGFPRSANTFSVVAFQKAQSRPVHIAHHLHVPAQIIEGVRRSLPTMLLLRRPADAIISLLLREDYLDAITALRDYIGFHRPLVALSNRIVIAPFDEVISDFGKTIHRMNEQFNTQYNVFRPEPDEIDKVFDSLDSLETETATSQVNENKVARPSEERKQKAAQIASVLEGRREKTMLRAAEDLYDKLLSNLR